MGVCLTKIRRWKSKTRYLGGKRVYEYERFSLNLPAKFGDIIEPFLNKDLDIEMRPKNDGLEIIFIPRENVSAPRKKPTQTI